MSHRFTPICLALLLPSQAAAAEDKAKEKPKKAVAKVAQSKPKPKKEQEPKKQRRPAAGPEVFEEALGEFYGDDYESAAALMYDYVSTNEDTVENYEWAEYFLGVSLKRLNFRHGAAEYLYNVAKNRTRPEILPDALLEIESLVEGPHDEGLIDNGLLSESEFGYLPPFIAPFVAYHQGLHDLKAGRKPWAQRLFDDIPEESPYKPKALYALGVERLRAGRTARAVALFRRVVEHAQTDRDDRNRARLALARVLYDKERYQAALKMYNEVEVPELSTAEASLFLEKAWTYYWLRNFRKTMGILYALEAPSYQDHFAPEKSLLRSLVYKNLCHYIPSKREIRRFRFQYGDTLGNIRSRIDLRKDDVLRGAALQDGQIQRTASFRRMLGDEADRIDTIGGSWVEVGLDEHLRLIYALKSTQTDLSIDALLKHKTRKVAEELVEFEEQMYLLDYEVGLAIYRRLKRENARRREQADNLDIPSSGDTAYYAFVDEFWNDELPTYDFLVENRCFDEGEKD